MAGGSGIHPPVLSTPDHQAADDHQLADQWARVRGRLQNEVGELEYRTWLRQMSLVGLDGDEVTVRLPTRFLRDWVRSHYGERLNALWQAENRRVRRVDIRVGGGPAGLGAAGGAAAVGCNAPAGCEASGLAESLGAAARADQAMLATSAPGRSVGLNGAAPHAAPTGPAAAGGTGLNGFHHGAMTAAAADGEGVALARSADDRPEPRSEAASPLDARFTFDSFVVGKPNEFAYACARRVAERPASPGFNPLFLYGGVGLGKTHLMHAIAWELTAPADARAPVPFAYMSAEKFMYRFISALRSQSTMEFKEELRGVDVLMIDDLQFLIGKEATQEEFFHTFNALVDAGKQIVVSADKSPSDLSGLEERVRTRLGSGMVADLHATTFELRISILETKAARFQAVVPHKVFEFLAHKITSNVRELEGALNRLVAHAHLFGRAITLESTQELLHDILKAHDRRVTIEEIQKRVSEHYNIRLTDMSSARRARAVARPRQVAMYLAKTLTSRSLPEIGRKFGNRDHTTVMHAVQRVGELMERDAAFAEDVELLRRMLES